jgi:hypothetical protein
MDTLPSSFRVGTAYQGETRGTWSLVANFGGGNFTILRAGCNVSYLEWLKLRTDPKVLFPGRKVTIQIVQDSTVQSWKIP